MAGSTEPTTRVFFTHIMKTGGTSLIGALYRCVAKDEMYPLAASASGMMFAKAATPRLLELPAPVRDRVRVFTAHQPAWVGRHVAPDAAQVVLLRDPVQRTVSHIRQIARIPGQPDDIHEIYDDEAWRLRLASYQTQLLSATLARYQEQRAATEAYRSVLSSGGDDAAASLRQSLRYFLATAIDAPRQVGPTEVAAAIETLDGMDVVGVTEDMAGFVAAVGQRTGLDLGMPGHLNAAEGTPAIDPALLKRIRRDQEADMVVFDHARRLARARGSRST